MFKQCYVKTLLWKDYQKQLHLVFFSSPKNSPIAKLSHFAQTWYLCQWRQVMFLVGKKISCSVVLCTKYNSLDERSCHASVKSGSLVIVTVVASGVVANCKFHFILAILCVRVCVRASMFFSSSNKWVTCTKQEKNRKTMDYAIN